MHQKGGAMTQRVDRTRKASVYFTPAEHGEFRVHAAKRGESMGAALRRMALNEMGIEETFEKRELVEEPVEEGC